MSSFSSQLLPFNSQQVMEALLAFGYEGAHREALVQRAGVSTATFYRALNPLLKLGLVEERSSSTYVLPLEHPHNFAFKLWHDQQSLLKLSAGLRDEVYRLLRELQKQLAENLLAVWLHGSATQNKLSPDSDVDFLVVLRKDQTVEISGPRPVQITSLAEKRFRADFQQGDPFVRTVMLHGVLLYDRDFAQSFYAQPFMAASPMAQKERAEMQDGIRSRLLFSIRQNSEEEGTEALSSFAVAVSRTMLDRLGVLPAGKGDLAEKVRFYFGDAFAHLIWRCTEKRVDSEEWLSVQDNLLYWQQQFEKHSADILRVATGLSASGVLVEVVVGEMLRMLVRSPLREAELVGQDQSFDFVWEAGPSGEPVYFMVKSIKAKISPRYFKGFKRDGVRVVIANQLRDIPLTERPLVSEEQIVEARESGFALLDSIEVFQAWMHQKLGLTGTPTRLADLIAARLLWEDPDA